MKTAVVILNWNGRKLLEQFLPSVVECSAEAEIYVADNASTDDSVAFLQYQYPRIKIIQNRINGGFAKGYNDALRNLKEDILILLNSDVAVTPGWLAPLEEEFRKNSKVAAVQPKIMDYKRKHLFEYAGAAGGFLDQFGYPYCKGRIFETLEQDHGQYDQSSEVFWASGACLGLRREAFEKAGGFDEDFFAHQEEIDLCWRFFNLKLLVMTSGFSTVYHLGGGTLEHQSPQKTFLNFRNNLYTLVKNLPSERLWLIIASRLFLDGLAGLKFLADGKPEHCLAVIRAHFSFYGNFSLMYRRRGTIVKRKDYYHRTSILQLYFLKKKKIFSKL